MSLELKYTMIEGMKCYGINEAQSYSDYPEEGFEVTNKLEKESFWVRSRSRVLKMLLLKYTKHNKNTTFLEIGCGTGAFIEELLSEKGLRILASEIYLKGLQYAKKKMPHVEFIQFDVTQGIIPERFDVIGSFDVLEHIEEDSTAIANIYKMLNQGGYFIATVPQYMFLWSKIDNIVKHKRRYSKNELLSKLQQQGFVIEYSTSFLFILFPLMLIVRLLDRNNDRSKEGSEFEHRVRFPVWLNWLFDKIMRIDEVLIKMGIVLPFGGSLIAVAKKP